jgi:Flp pilus assembly protein TadD
MANKLVFLALVGLGGAAPDAAFERAKALYQKAQYRAVIEELEKAPSGDAAALALLGKAYYGEGRFKEASEVFEQAVKLEPQNAHYWNWLGKAYGRRAETSSFLTAPRFASRCREAFEKAVELDPANAGALSDLFSYYLGAPGFLGGGLEKAAALAERIRPLDEAEYQWAQAELAKKRKDFASAERHLRRAAELAPRQIGRLLDLARFLARQGRRDESDALFAEARRKAPEDPEVLFQQARAYIEANRNLDEAGRLLEQYLAAELTPDKPSRWEAERLLRRVRGG